MADPFPQDIIQGIFSRLPIKSLARFRCVCKLWLKYINDPYLDTIRVKEEPTPIMFEQSESRPPIKVNLLRGSTRVRHEPVSELGHVGILPYGWLLVGLCDGLALVCYQQQPVGTYQIVVINPLSKQGHELPLLSIKMKPKPRPFHAAGIGFDYSTNAFKTVFSVVKDHVLCTMVHSSGSSSWREIAQTPPYPIGGEAVFAHGGLYWLFDFRALDSVGTTIVWFDMKTEEFGLTDPPKPKQVAQWTDINRLVYLNGELGYSFFGHYGIDSWILKEQEEEKWVLYCCFDLSPFLPPVNLDEMEEYYDMEISGCWNHHGDLLLSLDGGWRLFVYTLKTRNLRELDLGDPCHGSFIRMYQSSTLVLHDRFRVLESDVSQSSIENLSLVNIQNTKKIEKLNEVMTELVKEHEKEKERLNGIIAELRAEKEKDKLEKDAMKKRMMRNIEAMLTRREDQI